MAFSIEELFDSGWYLKNNPDVADTGIDPLVHYQNYGAAEGRDPNPLFMTKWYLEHNPDVAVNKINPLQHYIETGASEGRDPNPLFSTNWYLHNHPDLAAEGINPLLHYLKRGAQEGYDPHPLFDTTWYLDQNPDVAKAGLNPLVHYLIYGIKEGRFPNRYRDALRFIQQNLNFENNTNISIPAIKTNKSCLPDNAATYLQPDNERLVNLRKRYRSIRTPVTEPSLWSSEYINSEVNLQNFRDDCAYVWQYRDGNDELQYILSATYAKHIDSLDLFNLLQEDKYFGAHVFNFNDQYIISRDILDSIIEINFLERNLSLSQQAGFNVLDIGAGYGRLAHRMAVALPSIKHIFCVDAIPESTFISEYYLNFRGVNDKAQVVPLYNINKTLDNNNIFLATNIHSFSECTLGAIKWWLDLLKQYQVNYLMVVPNAEQHNGNKLISVENNNSRVNFLPEIESRGYKLIAMEPSYLDQSIQKFGVSPTHLYLFKLT